MSARQVRTQVCARIESLGYQRLESRGHEDHFLDPQTGHRVTLVPYPRWGRRIDVLTVESSFPMPREGRATAFRLDVGTQAHPEAQAQPGRWRPEEVLELVEAHVLPYLDRARSAEAVLDMLLAGDIRPIGSGSPRAIVQHGYYLTKWWQLADRLDWLREVAQLVPTNERADMRRAPWGRTEIAEVLWYGRDLPEPPARLPWGIADQGDPRADAWFEATGQRLDVERLPDDDAVTRGALHSPRVV